MWKQKIFDHFGTDGHVTIAEWLEQVSQEEYITELHMLATSASIVVLVQISQMHEYTLENMLVKARAEQ